MSERERKPRCGHFVGDLCRCDYVWRGANGTPRGKHDVSADAPLRVTIFDRTKRREVR